MKSFPELSQAARQKWTWRFQRVFWREWAKYIPWFFCNVSPAKWLTVIASANRVAWDMTRYKIAIQDEENLFTRSALKQNVMSEMRDKLQNLKEGDKP